MLNAALTRDQLLLKLPFSIPKSHVLPCGHLVLEILNQSLFGNMVKARYKNPPCAGDWGSRMVSADGELGGSSPEAPSAEKLPVLAPF